MKKNIKTEGHKVFSVDFEGLPADKVNAYLDLCKKLFNEMKVPVK